MNMKLFLRRTAAGALAAVILLFASALYSFAVTVDGKCSAPEWADAEVYNLTEQRDFHNSVKNSVVKTVCDSYDGCIYISVMTEYKNSGSAENAGIIIRSDNFGETEIKLDGSVSPEDADVESASRFDAESGCSVTEAALFYPDGNFDRTLFISITDLEGNESAQFRIETDYSDENEAENVSADSEKTDKPKTAAKKKSSSKKAATSKAGSYSAVRKKKTERPVSEYRKADKSKISSADKKTAGELSDTVEENGNTAVYDNSGLKTKYILTAAGAVCAAAISFTVVAASVRRNNKED